LTDGLGSTEAPTVAVSPAPGSFSIVVATPGADKTSNGVLVASVSPAAEAFNVKLVPAVETVRSENVATPLTALTVAVPPTPAPPEAGCRETVIACVAPATRFADASWTET
jgi:hypothetical protein